jgi:DNA-binding CsgD family transcriptional regulator
MSTQPDDNGGSASPANLSALTRAEQAVLDEALTGAPARDIAERLTLTEATVRSHLSRIYIKLGVSGRVALLAAFREAERPDEAHAAVHVGREQRSGPSVRPTDLTVGAWAWALISAVLGVTAVALLVEGIAVVGLVVLAGGAVLAATMSRRLLTSWTRPNLVRSAIAAGVLTVLAVLLLMDASSGAVLQQTLALGVAVLALVAGIAPMRSWERL